MKKAKLGSGVRFKKLANKMAREGVDDPDAVAAAIGRKKYGNKKMTAMAEKGRARHNKASGSNY
jgi:hypothetical protein